MTSIANALLKGLTRWGKAEEITRHIRLVTNIFKIKGLKRPFEAFILFVELYSIYSAMRYEKNTLRVPLFLKLS